MIDRRLLHIPAAGRIALFQGGGHRGMACPGESRWDGGNLAAILVVFRR